RVQVARQLHDHRSRAAHHLDALLAAADRGEAHAHGAGAGAGLHRAGDGPDLDVAAAGARLDRAGPAADADLSAAGGDFGPLRHVVQVHGATGPADVQVSDGLRADLDVLVVHLDVLEIPGHDAVLRLGVDHGAAAGGAAKAPLHPGQLHLAAAGRDGAGEVGVPHLDVAAAGREPGAATRALDHDPAAAGRALERPLHAGDAEAAAR